MKKFLKFLGISLLCCAGMTHMHAAQCSSANYIIQHISSEDKAILTELFRSLLFDDQFAYTLFGSKPITHKGVFFGTDTANFIPKWQVWKKYSYFFDTCFSNFAFLEKSNQELCEIHFVNKKLVLEAVEKYADAFTGILGEVKPKDVLERILKSNDLFEAIGNSQTLYGILLGYGEENARGFELNLPNARPFIEGNAGDTCLALPYFQTFSPCQETSYLRKQYLQEREKILSIYSRGNILEITLTRLCQD